MLLFILQPKLLFSSLVNAVRDLSDPRSPQLTFFLTLFQRASFVFTAAILLCAVKTLAVLFAVVDCLALKNIN